MTETLKLARDLQPGDRVVLGGQPGRPEAMTVLAVVPSVQTIRRKVVLVTVRRPNGTDIHRTFMEHSSIRIASNSQGGT